MPLLTREQRTSSQREANMARLRARIDLTINSGERAQAFSSSQGRYLQVGTRKVKLQNTDGTLTDSGRHYHAHLGDVPPLMYSYDQPLINDKWVIGYNGKRIMVRKKVNGQWQVTRNGEEYFRYNKMNILFMSQSAEWCQ